MKKSLVAILMGCILSVFLVACDNQSLDMQNLDDEIIADLSEFGYTDEEIESGYDTYVYAEQNQENKSFVSNDADNQLVIYFNDDIFDGIADKFSEEKYMATIEVVIN